MKCLSSLVVVVVVTVALAQDTGEKPEKLLESAVSGDENAKKKLLKLLDEKTLKKLLVLFKNPPVEQLVKNHNFSKGFDHWERDVRMRSGKVGVFEVKKDKRGETVFGYSRENSSDGSLVSVRQKLMREVRFKHIFVYIHCRILRHTLESSGWWSTERGGFGEYPVMVRIQYYDRDEKERWWLFGGLTKRNTEPFDNYWLLPKGRWRILWVDMLGDRGLLKPDKRKRNKGSSIPKPLSLKAVWVGGKGWEYMCEVERIGLLGVRNFDDFIWLLQKALNEPKGKQELFQAVLKRGLPEADLETWQKMSKALKMLNEDDWLKRKAGEKKVSAILHRCFPVFLALRFTKWKSLPFNIRIKLKNFFVEPVTPVRRDEQSN